jgi:hypothetical protein
MGLSHSPSIVSENLEFYIDPSNTRSYPGFGNTVYNLINSSMGCTFVNFTANPIDNANNRSIFFDNASNNALFIPSTNLQFGSSDFTIQFWFKFPGYSNNNGKAIFSDSWGPTNGGFLFYTYQSGGTEKILFYSTSTDGTWNIALEKDLIVSPSFNTWYNVAVTRTGSVFKLYANGQVTNTFSSSLSLRNTGLPYSLGASPTVANASKCSIGSVFIYREKGLSAAEINQNYHATKKQYLVEENIVSDGLVLNLDPGNSRSYAGVGNTIYDLSGLGNTGTLTNGPTFSALNGGNLIFDGSNDFLGAASSSSLDISTNLSAVVWMKLITIDGANHIIFSKTNSTNPFLSNYEAYLKNDVIYWWDSPTERNTTVTLSINSWTQVVFVRSSTSLLIYKNGTLSNTISVNQVGPIVGDFYIGKDPNGQFLNFNLAQFLLYNRALSAQEILQNYNATKNRFINVLPPVRNNLILELDASSVSSYPGTGTTWYDLSGNNYNSTLVGSPVFSGIASTANFLFDANTKSATLNTNLLSNYSSGTIECSVYITNLASSFILARQRNGVNTFSVLSVGSYCDAGGQFLAGLAGTIYYHNKNAQTVLSSSTALLVNTWYRLSITFTTSSVILYINGIQNATVAGDYSVPNDASTDPRIGAWIKDGTNYPMNGRLAHFTIYNRALSAYEIKQNFDFYRTRYGI